jgi:hypothetical protein
MRPLRKCSSLLLPAFLTAYGGAALAAPTPRLPSQSNSAAVVQAQPETPVDCKETPNHPRCRPIGRGPLRGPASNLTMSDK